MNFVKEYLAELKDTLDRIPLGQIETIKDILFKAHRDGKSIFIMGNGGSAATASHFAHDLTKGVTIKAIALTDNVPLLTAYANDTGYVNIFAGQLQSLLEKDDVVIAISASGNSENILWAVDYANSKNAITIGLTGFEGGKLKDKVRVPLIVPSNSMEQIEDVHLILGHLLCCYLRKILG